MGFDNSCHKFKVKDSEWLTGLKKQKQKQKIQGPPTSICCLQETHFSKDTDRLKMREQKKMFHANGNQNKAEEVTLISDKIGFITKTVRKDKQSITYG